MDWYPCRLRYKMILWKIKVIQKPSPLNAENMDHIVRILFHHKRAGGGNSLNKKYIVSCRWNVARHSWYLAWGIWTGVPPSNSRFTLRSTFFCHWKVARLALISKEKGDACCLHAVQTYSMFDTAGKLFETLMRLEWYVMPGTYPQDNSVSEQAALISITNHFS